MCGGGVWDNNKALRPPQGKDCGTGNLDIGTGKTERARPFMKLAKVTEQLDKEAAELWVYISRIYISIQIKAWTLRALNIYVKL